jgi:adenylate kinase
MNIVFTGPSGGGKGTHADRLSARYNLQHISTGNLLRQNLESRSALGILARKYMERGELVPDEVVDAMIEESLGKLSSERGTLFDGFPRTAYQARFLDDLLKQLNRTLDAAIYLDVSDEEIVNRLSGRLTCRKCQTPYNTTIKPPEVAGVCDQCGGQLYQRSDDTADMARTRLRVFHRAAGQLVEHYTETKKLVIVTGEGAIDAVNARLVEALEAVSAARGVFATREGAAAITAVTGAGMLPGQFARPSLDIVLVGGPGSGKGTQAEALSKQLNLPHIATGDLFRDNLKNATDLGKLAKTYMDRGELVPDDVTEAMVEERLARPDTHDGFILDGFPRTLPQAQALMDMMAGLQRRIAGVLYISVTDEAIVNRLSGRLICRRCQSPYHQQFKPPRTPGFCDNCAGDLYQRDDDNPNTVRARLKTFHGQTEPLIEYYQKVGVLQEISGEGEVSQVIERSLAAARSLANAVKASQPDVLTIETTTPRRTERHV